MNKRFGLALFFTLVSVGIVVEPSLTAPSLTHSSKPVLQTPGLARFVQFLADYKDGLKVQWITDTEVRETQIDTEFNGGDLVMGEGLGGIYPFVWEASGVWDATQNPYTVLYYRWLSADGDRLFARRLIEQPDEEVLMFDIEPNVAQSAEGSVGVTWIRNIVGQQSTYNVHFRRIDPQGEPLGAAINLTQQPLVGTEDLITYSEPRVVFLTNPERWLLVWQKTAGEQDIAEIEWTLINADGSQMPDFPKTLVELNYLSQLRPPSLLAVGGSQALIFYSEFSEDQNKNILKGALLNIDDLHGTPIEIEIGAGWRADSVLMENGDVVVAWTDESSHQTRARRLQKSAEGFTPLGSTPIELPAPGAPPQTDHVSLTRASANTIVVTWQDVEEYDTLYYALLQADDQEPSGLKVLTPPMIFYTATDNLKVLVSAAGQGNAPYPPAQLYLPLILRR